MRGVLILTLHPNYIAGYTNLPLFHFEWIFNYSESQVREPWACALASMYFGRVLSLFGLTGEGPESMW